MSAAQLDWKTDWEQNVAAAKKEGQVNVYIYRYEGLLQDFKRDFPGINVVAVSGRGNELTTRLMSERRAGKYHRRCLQRRPGGNYNVLYKGKALDPIKPLLSLPEVVDESKWYGKEHRYADAEGKYVFAYLASPSDAQLAFNTTTGQSQGIQILLGCHATQVEGQDRLARSARRRIGRHHAVLLLQSGNRSGIYQKVF